MSFSASYTSLNFPKSLFGAKEMSETKTENKPYYSSLLIRIGGGGGIGGMFGGSGSAGARDSSADQSSISVASSHDQVCSVSSNQEQLSAPSTTQYRKYKRHSGESDSDLQYAVPRRKASKTNHINFFFSFCKVNKKHATRYEKILQYYYKFFCGRN